MTFPFMKVNQNKSRTKSLLLKIKRPYHYFYESFTTNSELSHIFFQIIAIKSGVFVKYRERAKLLITYRPLTQLGLGWLQNFSLVRFQLGKNKIKYLPKKFIDTFLSNTHYIKQCNISFFHKDSTR